MKNRDRVLEYFRENKNGWKEKVASNIEAYRKGDAAIRIVDKNGAPIANAMVEATQTSHAFRFGANVFLLDGLESEEKLIGYKTLFAEVFNMATIPFYWSSLEPSEGAPRYDIDSPHCYRRPAIDLCMAFCKEYGIEPREHGLAYEMFFPKWLWGASTERVKAAYEHRCAEIAERYADKIPTIEVTNEMKWEEGKTAFYKDPEFVTWCFQTARKYFKNNELGINDWTGLAWGQSGTEDDLYYAYIADAFAKGAPIDAIGMQYHMFEKPENEYAGTRGHYDPDCLYQHMNLYAQFDRPLQVTEVTVPSYTSEPYDEEIQAEILDNLYRIWFSHPSVEQIVYWNLVDGYAHVWSDDPKEIEKSLGDMTLGENIYAGGLMRFDMTPKPAYFAIKHLLQEEWHTEAACQTDGNGNASFRGFFGDYALHITANGKAYEKTVSLSKGECSEFVIVLD